MPEDNNNNHPDHGHTPSDTRQDRDWEIESNPFVAFRRFADEQVSSVLQSITGLPSTVSPPQPDNWTIFTNDDGYKSMAYRQKDGTDNASEQTYPANGGGATNSGGDRDDSANNTEKTPPRASHLKGPKEVELWQRRHQFPDLFGLGSLFDELEEHFPFSPWSFPSHTLIGANKTLLKWPLSYISFSPYSPLWLERQSRYQAHREEGVFSSLMSSLHLGSDSSPPEHDPNEPQWREAFEDLLRLENGKPMLDRSTSTPREPDDNYMYGLAQRGSMGDRWKLIKDGDPRFPEYGLAYTHRKTDSTIMSADELRAPKDQEQLKAEAEEAQTELDLYDRFLLDIGGRAHEMASKASESPLLRSIIAEQQRMREESEEFQRGFDTFHQQTGQAGDDQGTDDTESWLDLVSGGNRKSVPEAPPTEPSVADQKPTDNVSSNVVFTQTQTERRTRPDGSIWCKTIKTKRFADGREETDESIDVHHLQHEDAPSADSNEKPKNGWFWRE